MNIRGRYGDSISIIDDLHDSIESVILLFFGLVMSRESLQFTPLTRRKMAVKSEFAGRMVIPRPQACWACGRSSPERQQG
jgi:hypothetical protein